MAERNRHNRQAGKRQPLGEIRTGANTPTATPKQHEMKPSKVVSSSPAHHLPHNESLEPNGSLTVRTSQPNSPEHKRVSQIASEHDGASKRNSAISTTSTNASGRRRKQYIGHWQLGKTIGKGGCSRVRVVRHRFRDQYGAVKIITRSTAENTRAQSLANLIESTKGTASFSATGQKPIPFGLEREIAVMKLLEHENIVRLYDVWENRNELYLIMEYVDGGELFHYVDERKGLSEDEAVYIFRQIVSALLYCHRLLICHRDLKPENILLNKKDLTVKLIDFGMAALQPKGRLLSTPCGSPHYAAPEVVSSKPYDGTQADVWSCGVILYVMLTGTTPFNYSQDGDIRVLFRDIARARYWMPPDLSLEAKDLITRIFRPDPGRRITMDGVWDHPLLHKYDEEFGFLGKAGTKEAAIGPEPTIDQWKIKRIQDIDREILRNMRTLWHSDSEQTLIQKLLDNDLNQEKLFYAALIKHREEQFENYVGNTDDMDYSASDYHHSQPPKMANAPPLPKVPRSQSQYSIMNDEHLRPSPSFVEPPPSSVSSYDPYRASKDPLVNARGEYVNVTVHRQGSAAARKASMKRTLRHPNGLRVEMLKHGKRPTSNASTSSLVRSHRSRHSMQRSSVSRNSMTSSNWPSSPPVIASMRPSDVHKRNVSFGHLRRTSTTSALASQTSTKATPATPRLPEHARDLRTLRALEAGQPASSPTIQAAQAVRSRKEKAAAIDVPRIKVRKPETPNQHMRSEIRKHSAELEKACEEAFFRSSVGSSLTGGASTAEPQTPADTPPSSVSAHSQQLPVAQKEGSRPLPELPRDTPTTYLTKTLEEARDNLARYMAVGDETNSRKFDEVMRMLENIMPTVSTPPTKEHRNFTAPEARTPDHLGGFLPVISEESDNHRSSREGTGNWRSVTAPVQQGKKADDKTIRVVQPSSPGVVPLNVRKRSNGSEASDDTLRRLAMQRSAERLTRKRTMETVGGLTAIDEDSTLPATPTIVRKKRSGWFGLSRKPEDLQATVGASIQDLYDRQEKQPSRTLTDKALPDAPPPSGVSSEFPIRKKRFGGGKNGFGKWLGRKRADKENMDVSEMTAGDTTGVTYTNTNRSLDSLFSSAPPAPSSHDGPPAAPPGTERSWFARFFHIKPLVKPLCFSIPRGRARQELVILLREWQRHGVRDLQYSRETNTIAARVDRQNTLDIKPVSFRIEMFVVLEHGRKVGLCIGRFVLVKGSGTGFRSVVEVVDGVMRGRGWLVEDEEKWRALCEVVGG